MEKLGASYSPKATRPVQDDPPQRSTYNVPSYKGPPRQPQPGMDSSAREKP